MCNLSGVEDTEYSVSISGLIHFIILHSYFDFIQDCKPSAQTSTRTESLFSLKSNSYIATEVSISPDVDSRRPSSCSDSYKKVRNNSTDQENLLAEESDITIPVEFIGSFIL